MDPMLIIAGIAIGLSVAAPLGPVNLLVIRASLRRGWQAGVIVGCGAVLADTILATLAAFGTRAVERFVNEHNLALTLIAGCVLVAIGFHAVRSHTAASAFNEDQPLAWAKLSRKSALAMVLTLTNPGSFLGFLALFGGMSSILQLSLAPMRPVMVVLGVIVGGLAWWFAIASFVARVRSKLTPQGLDRINHWTGVIIIAFGFVLLMRAADAAL